MARITVDRVLDLKRQADETGDAFDDCRFQEALDSMSTSEYLKFTAQAYGWTVMW
jgi:hypothetical protein